MLVKINVFSDDSELKKVVNVGIVQEFDEHTLPLWFLPQALGSGILKNKLIYLSNINFLKKVN